MTLISDQERGLTSGVLGPKPTAVFLFVSLLTAGCVGLADDETRPGADGLSESGTAGAEGLSAWPCLAADSMIGGSIRLTYREERSDQETGDVAGQEYALVLSDGAWSGTTRNAEGEWGPYRDMSSVLVNTAGNSVEFEFVDGPQEARFLGVFDCLSLEGRLMVGGAQYSLAPISRRDWRGPP